MAGILGLLVGSFLNVVILRMRTNHSLLGRSKCVHCHQQLHWYMLIPVLSYMAQRGRCFFCKKCISTQYVLVEILTAVLFVAVTYHFAPLVYGGIAYALLNMVIWYVITALFIVLSVYDIKHMIVPDRVVIPFVSIAFLSLFFAVPHTLTWGTVATLPIFSHGIAGPILALPFLAIWFFSKGRLFGFGDIKIIVGIGWLLGLGWGLLALMLSFWIAVCVILGISLIHMIRSRSWRSSFSMKQAIPFGPFLVTGVYTTLFFGNRIALIIFGL